MTAAQAATLKRLAQDAAFSGSCCEYKRECRDVRYWHKADIPTVGVNVLFRR